MFNRTAASLRAAHHRSDAAFNADNVSEEPTSPTLAQRLKTTDLQCLNSVPNPLPSTLPADTAEPTIPTIIHQQGSILSDDHGSMYTMHPPAPPAGPLRSIRRPRRRAASSLQSTWDDIVSTPRRFRHLQTFHVPAQVLPSEVLTNVVRGEGYDIRLDPTRSLVPSATATAAVRGIGMEEEEEEEWDGVVGSYCARIYARDGAAKQPEETVLQQPMEVGTAAVGESSCLIFAEWARIPHTGHLGSQTPSLLKPIMKHAVSWEH
ncbi:unnamed protein product [Zymoseptoria tritici ST99CH_1A5]|uniref:Uncharacterized protein n=1 Tax=Zymoseptoria tritici ST99CH_1A5 TaxID=1276529 RepID=A0A1Y6M1J8_ZYMTR|nr:unnamed protein product [Zymoseptoria tritici ST99CH_1A5]